MEKWIYKLIKKDDKIEMNITQPKTINEAIDEFQTFLECDLYTRFRPAHTLPIGKGGKDEVWYRDGKDVFMSERDFLEYLRGHFDIFRKEVKELSKVKKK